MADSDPITDSSPTGAKRRKLEHTAGSNSKVWDEEDDSGDDLFEDHETVATLPVNRPGRLSYSSEQMRSDLAPMSNTYGHASSPAPHVTQPTQPLQSQTYSYATQPTQLMKRKSPSEDVQVERSSPIAPSSDTSMQPPVRKAPFAKPTSMLASAMAPPGTAFRRPAGLQEKPKPATVNLEDSDEDPAVDYSSDEATQKGLKSNIRPTNFTKGGRGLDSSPNRVGRDREAVVRESPRATPFASMVTGFAYPGSPTSSKSRQADDMAGAYGGVSRAPRPPPQQKQTGPSRAQPVNGSPYQTIDDIPDFRMQRDVQRIQAVLPAESVQRCMDALTRCRNSFEDAMAWLSDTSEAAADSVDELALTPAKPAPKGVARAVGTASQSSQPVRPSARQEVKVPKQTIAEKYGTQAARKPSEAEAPKRRLVQKRPENRAAPSLSPEPSPPPKRPQPVQRARARQTITIDSDSEKDSGVVSDDDEVEEIVQENAHEKKLLQYFNDASVQSIVDTCTLPEPDVAFVLEKRPFSNLDEIRALTNAPTLTKSGKKSRTKPIGGKMVDACSEMLTGYDAVSDLVTECEQLAKPIQDTLKSWGVGDSSGELQLMNLEEAHDSGIGTPTSSYHSDDPNASKSTKGKKGRFLTQPENMNPEIKLKDYQLVGLNWLSLLWSKKISCILADDMGLGKTCQVISFLSHLQIQEVDGVHLVIVPGSTLENWLREFQNFAPELKVVPYYGSQAERPTLQQQIEDDFSTIDVIVTTYDMTVKPDDNKFLRHLEPSVCVYDEAHALRNPKSDRYRQLMRIPADFKILLTGTPLQNNLQELIAVLAFIMPDLFVKKQEELNYIFQHKATTKDTDHAALLSEERMAKARSMMTPFILRRKKQQVLWLPAKHSRVEYCDMTDSQANMYADEIEAAQKVFADKASGKKAPAKTSSNALMNLRKAAIHPLLSRRVYDDKKLGRIQTALLKHDEFAGNPPDRVWKYLVGEGPQTIKGGDFGMHRFCEERPYLHKYMFKHQEWMDCGKVQKFKSLVQAYQQNGDRALVFSQFTTLMDILETVLTTLGIKYMRLDGSTPMDQRQDMLDEFSSNPEITVFMLSTKAGGAGINLAAANKVIIFDSGFNPQDDIQAENRAHRVGQTRDVEVVRLVSRGTIEEQIHALGESKLALDERVAGEAAGGGEDKAAEKEGEKAVERMLAESLQMKGKEEGGEGDLREDFKKGLVDAGLEVA